MMQLVSRVVETVIKYVVPATYDWNFTVVIHNSSDSPDEWFVTLEDYDDSIGAFGLFASEQEAIDNLDGFAELAIPAYYEKHAKSGCSPIITLKDGTLVMELENPHES